jgi:diguanylate cyclase (GGDEF)-like protein
VLESDRYFRDIISRHSNSSGIINDYTTGIYNRATGEKLINSMMEEKAGVYSFLIIDIDHFRQINDQIGVQAADRMLFELAQMLTAMFRTNDVVARIGDDEICVLMTNIAGEETVEVKCCQITDKVSALDLKLTEAYLTCTIGAVVFEKAMTFDDMLVLANDELEKARNEKSSWSVRVIEDK